MDESKVPDYCLMSPKQFKERVNALLDTPIGVHAIYALVKRKDFPSIKLGGKYFIIEDKVAAWMKENARKRKA